MSGLDVAILCSGVGGLFILLSWVGWRFFVAQLPASGSDASHGLRAGAAPARKGVLRQFLRRSAGFLWVTLLALVVGSAVVAAVFSLYASIVPEPLEVQEWARQSHIQGRLSPERLVPPPPLPPSLFVSSERPALESADRDWNKLHPDFAQSVLRLLAAVGSRGYRFALIEGYRSPDRQEMLAGLGAHVTSAKAFQSRHQYGLAADLAPVRNGTLLISERDPWAMQAYLALGEEAGRLGLTWGGNWWFKDYGHVEVPASPKAR